MLIPNPAVEALLPVHNEGESIESTLREIYAEVSPRVALQFIVTEDGSKDNTKQVLSRVSESLPIKLLMSESRKGYGVAIIDGMRQLEAPFLWHLDSDGQIDPKDFWKFWEARASKDVLIGWRVVRHDSFWRRAMSFSFYVFYQLVLQVPVHDPSCSFILTRRDVVEKLVSELGEMKEGFWWEFIARAHRRGFKVGEFPINHRERLKGKSRVYDLDRLPGIAYRHFVALIKVWAQTRA